MPAAPLMTVNMYFQTPKTVLPAELKFGILHVADAPSPMHQSVVAQLFVALRAHVGGRKLGQVWLSPLDVVLDQEKALVVQPDLMFISNGRSWIVKDRIRGAPDLVIEVLSPNPRIGTTEEHLRWFAHYGVRECWLVHHDQHRISVIGFDDSRASTRRLTGRNEPIVSRVLPEFSMSLQQILEL